MQTFFYLLPLLAIFDSTFAVPTNSLESRQASTCGTNSNLYSGSYTLASNQWGASAGAGSQCDQINGNNGGSLSWQTTWSWENNPNTVKSYTNVVSSSTYCTPLSSISSLPTSFSWSYSGTDIRANVAYDTFLGYTCGGAQAYEVMVWLADLGDKIYPLSNNGYPPTPSASPYIAGTQFNLVIGTYGNFPVYSFVAQSQANDFSGDLMDFYHYLETNEGLPSSVSILSIQAGSEVFTGSDVEFSVYGYSLSQS